jgi:plasmid stabilization system protein ParE
VKADWAKEALDDLDRLASHRRGDTPDAVSTRAAEIVVQKLIAAAEGLLQFPLIGRPYGNRRRLVVDGYCLFYKVGRDPLSIEVLRLRHGKELPFDFENEAD